MELKKLGVAGAEIVVGVICLFLFFNGKTFVLEKPETPAFNRVKANIVQKHEKSGGGGRFGGSVKTHVITLKGAECEGKAHVTAYRYSKLEQGSEIEVLSKNSVCYLADDIRWGRFHYALVWVYLILGVGLTGNGIRLLR